MKVSAIRIAVIFLFVVTCVYVDGAISSADAAFNLFGLGEKESPDSKTDEGERKEVARSLPSPTEGPKKRIAVVRFLPHGKFKAAYGGWDIGGGLAAQLVTALVKSGHFIVVERAELSSVLREQIMGKQQIISKGTAAKVGRVLGAQLLVRGSVTEFDQETGGGGLNVGVPISGFGGLKLGGETVSGHVAIDLRLIDTTSGQIIQSHRAEGRISKSGVAANITAESVTFGGDAFKKTPLGLAARKAIEDAVRKIIQTMEKVPWEARAVRVIGEKVYINAGSKANIKVGDMFTAYSPGEELIDPQTNLSLGFLNQKKQGRVRIEQVQPKFSVAVAEGDFSIKQGYIFRTK